MMNVVIEKSLSNIYTNVVVFVSPVLCGEVSNPVGSLAVVCVCDIYILR